MKILSIGNSFSQDATRYLHKMALSAGDDITTVNLNIGGCSLEMHWQNAFEDNKSYYQELNGAHSDSLVSIKEMVLSEKWDFITLQQVSHHSVDYNTYQPYLTKISEYLKKLSPESRQVIHQTWSYEENSDRLCNELGYIKAADMLSDIKTAYIKAAHAINAYGIIPCGEVFMKMLEYGIDQIHRDTFHASLGLGRYALALTWYVFFTGKNPDTLDFSAFDEPIAEKEIQIAKTAVKEIFAAKNI